MERYVVVLDYSAKSTEKRLGEGKNEIVCLVQIFMK